MKNCYFPFVLTGLVLILGACSPAARAPDEEGSTPAPMKPLVFEVKEHFGVSHPEQILTFDVAEPLGDRQVALLDEAGEAVPFQFVDEGRRVAVRTDLQADATRHWTMVDTHDRSHDVPGDPELLQVHETRTFHEITSARSGIRIPRVAENLTSAPAPVQGVRLADGTWTGMNPAPLNIAAKVKGMTVTFLERGPLEVKVQVRYDLEADDDSGGFYQSTITLQAGQPSIMFEEDTDTDVTWSLNLHPGLEPDQARYRGHHAKSVRDGYEEDGQPYRQWHQRPSMDAFVDLTFDQPRSYRSIAVWDPWRYNTGWYWQMYNSEAGDDANMVGIFAGRASRAVQAGNSGVGAYSGPHGVQDMVTAIDDGGRKDGKLSVYAAATSDAAPRDGGEFPETERRSAGITVSVRSSSGGPSRPHVRYQWGLFTGVKGKDLLPPTEVQPINRQMNLHGGFNLDKISRYKLDLPEPADGYGAMYMPRETRDRMIAKLRADGKGPHGGGYHSYLYNADPTIRPLIDMWVDESGEKAREQAGHIANEARRILNAFVNEGGIYNMGVHYWHGGLAMSRLTVWIDQVLAEDALGADARARIKAAAALFGYLLWDNDFVPLHTGHGLNLGTANMPVQQTGYRHQYALLLNEHPDFTQHAQSVAAAALSNVHATINEHGAHMGSSHYLGASMGPLLNTLVQLKQTGLANAFADEPRLRHFAEFYMQFVTPPDPRYDNLRIRIPTGNAEANNPQFMAGVLGTAFADVDSELSARLMGSWAQSGKPHTGFHVSTLLMTDEDLPQADPTLGSDTFPGYFSVLRSGWGEPHEAVLWLVGGQWYRDHRNHGEHGMISLYAHAAPLALNWGPMYTPYAPSLLLRNTLVPAAADWKALPIPHEANVGDWGRSTLGTLNMTPEGGQARCTTQGFDTEWKRNVHLHQAGPAQPVFVIDDRFSDVPLVFSLAMACTDEITTPAGVRRPGQEFALPAGVSRLDFTGQPLDKHPNGGIDWSLFILGDTPRQGFLTEWSHQNRRGQRQVMLRVKGDNDFRVVIVPWPKGRQPDDLTVVADGENIVVTVNGETVRIASPD